MSSDWHEPREDWEFRSYADVPDVPDRGDSDDGADTDIDELDQSECATEFFNLLVSMKMSGNMSAKHVCVLSFWAQRGGLAISGSKLALNPNRTGGAFSEHFDHVVGVSTHLSSEFYKLAIPGHERCTLGRTTVDHSAVLGHQAIAEEIANIPDFEEQFRDLKVILAM
jgi:hypothetical protein